MEGRSGEKQEWVHNPNLHLSPTSVMALELGTHLKPAQIVEALVNVYGWGRGLLHGGVDGFIVDTLEAFYPIKREIMRYNKWYKIRILEAMNLSNTIYIRYL